MSLGTDICKAVSNRRIRLCLLAALGRTKRSGSAGSLTSIFTLALFLLLLTSGCAHRQAPVGDQFAHPALLPTQPPKRANFEQEHKSRNAQLMADWVLDSGDNRGMSFAIVDKVDAKVFVFGADGKIRGAAPVLLGLARGDESIPGIGDRKLSEVRPEERTTPAGRFVASIGYNFHGKDVLWVDYDGAVSMHRVVTSNPKERRLERLATPTPQDNRISYGCINVPAEFFNKVISPTFTGVSGVVYVLPETRSNREVFASYYEVE